MKDENQPLKEAGAKHAFPAPVYSDTVLTVNFEDAKKYFLESLLELHYAHTLMLVRQGILPVADARACLRALGEIDCEALKAAQYDGRFEDLFFYIENLIGDSCTPNIAGKMHTARSRNDIDLTLYRMGVRKELLKIIEAAINVRGVILDLAARNLDTVMPAHTHTQPAQPTTLAHYLMASVEWLGRDITRLQAAFVTTNRSPLGACAITTTGFPIDREYTARLLGFEGLQINSYGAIAAIDYLTEAAAAVAVCMINLGKLVQDLLLWCTMEFGFLRLSEGFVQTSSIMPQKRNPVSLEHSRILASKSLGQAQALMICAHNTPFGDIVDSEDDVQPLAYSMFADAHRALRLVAGLLSQAEVDRPRLRQRAGENFLTVTELADTLVREDGLDFRSAHHLISAAVKAAGQTFNPDRVIAELQRLAPEIVGQALKPRLDDWRRALDPEHFIQLRTVAGGPAPEAVNTEINKAKIELGQMKAWRKEKTELLAGYPHLIRHAIDAIPAG